MTLQVTLYTRPGCCLCDDAKAVIQPLLAECGAELREINIDGDATLIARFGHDIPVIYINDHKAAKHRVDPEQFRRQLADAAAKAI
jgi:glutaredoxin